MSLPEIPIEEFRAIMKKWYHSFNKLKLQKVAPFDEIYWCTDDKQLDQFVSEIDHPMRKYIPLNYAFACLVWIDENNNVDLLLLIYDNMPGDSGYVLYYLPKFIVNATPLQQLVKYGRGQSIQDFVKPILHQVHMIENILGTNFGDVKIAYTPKDNGLLIITTKENVHKVMDKYGHQN